jgi:mannan endo-1,4-beta-mannosidase
MLEYCETEHRYIEKPIGSFNSRLVQFWDDLFALCERTGIRILLTPFDTFFTWTRWKWHPYNEKNGGPCSGPGELLSSPKSIEAIKNRIEFATRRWGGGPALFAWDIWNEMHPAHAGGKVEFLRAFVSNIAPWLKSLEMQLHGRRHPITASVFGPELGASPGLREVIFRHPDLDFANIHLYERGTIDKPANTVAPAIATGRLMQAAADEITDQRPLFDSEHGPIHGFMDKKIVLPVAFDDEYFRHIQWAHLASGGAGGGMRWPNRHPHVLTSGMRRAQSHLHAFLPLISWAQFNRRCLNNNLRFSRKGVSGFACGDERQVLLWLLRTDAISQSGLIKPDVKPVNLTVVCPATDGQYSVRLYDTKHGRQTAKLSLTASFGRLAIPVRAFGADIAIAAAAS